MVCCFDYAVNLCVCLVVVCGLAWSFAYWIWFGFVFAFVIASLLDVVVIVWVCLLVARFVSISGGLFGVVIYCVCSWFYDYCGFCLLLVSDLYTFDLVFVFSCLLLFLDLVCITLVIVLCSLLDVVILFVFVVWIVSCLNCIIVYMFGFGCLDWFGYCVLLWVFV